MEKPGLEFVNKIKGGNVPREYIPSVEKGFKDAMKNGPLAGFEVDSMKITLKGWLISSSRFRFIVI